jgi:hypothetical protein
MWFRWFVLLRLPISAVCLFGYGTALSIWDMGPFGGVFIVGLFFFLAFVSIRLVRFRRGALQLAGWLLAVELVGAVLLLAGGDYLSTRTFNPVDAFGVAVGVVLLWVLPNGAVLYSQRAKFTDQKQKPGL